MNAQPMTATKAKRDQRKRQRDRLRTAIEADRTLMRDLTMTLTKLHRACDRYDDPELREARVEAKAMVERAVERLRVRT